MYCVYCDGIYCLTGANFFSLFFLQTSVKSHAWGHQVFRGNNLGEKKITRCYKHDWRLIPKSEEESFIKYDKDLAPPPVIPDKLYFAPLHEYLILNERKMSGDKSTERPYMQIVINKHSRSRAKLESELELLEGDSFKGEPSIEKT